MPSSSPSSSPISALCWIARGACAAALITLTGCAGFSGSAVPTGQTSATLPKGSVHGGQQPIAYSQIYIFRVNTTSYGGPSTSLINSTGANTYGPDSNGNYYVETDANGDFYFGGGDITCSANDQLYVLAVGGNPGFPGGNTVNNLAIQLIAPLGPCSGINANTFVNINEVSTALTVSALRPYITDGLDIGVPAANASAFSNAVNRIYTMMNEATGTVYSSTTAGNGTVPAAEINTIADILSPCANSSMQTSMECSNLISATTYGGTTPSNTLGAILQIANYPANEVATLFSQKSANPPFQPILPTSPNDYSIGVTYSGNSLTQPGLLVVDANGAIWMANCQSCATPGATDSILEFDPTATGGDTFTTYTNSHIHSTQGLAFDNSGNLWTTNQAAGSAPDEVTKMTGNTLVGSYSGSDLSGPTAIAVDSSDRAWLSSTNNSNILWMSPSVTEMTGSPFLPSYTGIAAPYGIGLDNGGNVWVAATGTSSLLELSSIGTLESAAGGYTPSGLAGPVGVSIDSSNNIWTVDGGSTNAADVSEVSSSGTNVGGSPYSDFLYTAAVIAIDGSGQAWIPNCRSGCPSSGDSTDPDEILRLSNSGADNLGTNDSSNPGALSSIQKPGPSGFAGVASVAIDPGGNLWVANRFGGTITEVLGVATPVLTPVAAASKAGVLGSPAP